MTTIKKLCVFCGSKLGENIQYAQHAEILAELLVEHQITLVYGGASVGLMGKLADRMLQLGGDVIGVMPSFLVDKEVAHANLPTLHVVNTMAERKKLLMDLSDAFVMLPGGEGSLDEFFEVMVLAKLGMLKKPIGILNTENYYDFLLKFLNHSVKEKFITLANRDALIVANTPQQLISAFIKTEELV